MSFGGPGPSTWVPLRAPGRPGCLLGASWVSFGVPGSSMCASWVPPEDLGRLFGCFWGANVSRVGFPGCFVVLLGALGARLLSPQDAPCPHSSPRFLAPVTL